VSSNHNNNYIVVVERLALPSSEKRHKEELWREFRKALLIHDQSNPVEEVNTRIGIILMVVPMLHSPLKFGGLYA